MPMTKPTTTPTTPRRSRGYLLMEMMVGGAMAAVILLGVLSLIASARAANIAARRDITANQLVTEMIEQKRFGAFPPTAVVATPISAAGGVYTRTVDVTDGPACPETRTNPGGGPAFSLACRDVTVTVTFDNQGVTRTASATMRMYQ